MTRAPAATVLWLALLTAWLSAGQQVFRLAVDAVAVDVLVTRGRQPVTGLTAEDFTLRDNGVAQRIDSIRLEDVPITLLLVLDTSASVRGPLLEQLKAAAAAAAGTLRPGDAIGLITFANRVQLIVAPPAEPAGVVPHLGLLVARGETTLVDATFSALVLREQTPQRTLVLVFTDGDDTASALDPRDVVDAARSSDVVVHVVALERVARDGSPQDPRQRRLLRNLFEHEPELYRWAFLGRLAEETGGSLLAVSSSDVRTAFVRMVQEFRSRYVLTYSPAGVAVDGWHEITVDVRRRGVTVQARRGYLR